MVLDYGQLFETLRSSRWMGLELLASSFVTAANANPWMWAVLVATALGATSRGWVRLLKYVGGAYLHRPQ